MKNISLKTKILTGLLTGGIYFSTASTTFAVTTTPLNINGNAPIKNEYKLIDTKIGQCLTSSAENLIPANRLTEDAANKIKAIISKSRATKNINFEMTKSITEQESNLSNKSNDISHINPITTLLEDGTISESQAEKILLKQIYLYHIKKLNSLL